MDLEGYIYISQEVERGMAEGGPGEFRGVDMIKINMCVNSQRINFKTVKYTNGMIVYV